MAENKKKAGIGVIAFIALILIALGLTTNKTPTPPPDNGVNDQNTEHQISVADLTILLEHRFPNAQLMLFDEQYYYVSMDKWQEIFTDVLSNMPKHEVDRFDCENFAFLTIARVNERYRLNSIGFAIGMGWSHSFNVFIADDGVHTLDAETGEIDLLNVADLVIMG